MLLGDIRLFASLCWALSTAAAQGGLGRGFTGSAAGSHHAGGLTAAVLNKPLG